MTDVEFIKTWHQRNTMEKNYLLEVINNTELNNPVYLSLRELIRKFDPALRVRLYVRKEILNEKVAGKLHVKCNHKGSLSSPGLELYHTSVYIMMPKDKYSQEVIYRLLTQEELCGIDRHKL